jgi:hypothetical protein
MKELYLAPPFSDPVRIFEERKILAGKFQEYTALIGLHPQWV